MLCKALSVRDNVGLGIMIWCCEQTLVDLGRNAGRQSGNYTWSWTEG
ncbi:MAG: hypothetical protein MK165_16310 [Pirellulaceae bacterium]|nr:hypothetical protein [Pirellulaceae bacterium]